MESRIPCESGASDHNGNGLADLDPFEIPALKESKYSLHGVPIWRDNDDQLLLAFECWPDALVFISGRSRSCEAKEQEEQEQSDGHGF